MLNYAKEKEEDEFLKLYNSFIFDLKNIHLEYQI